MQTAVKLGRPEEQFITPEVEERAIALALSGKTLTKILADLQIDRVKFWKYRKHNRSFANDFAQAVAEGQHAQVDRLQDICEEYPDVMQARLVSENIRWSASKKLPSVYGDRLEVNVQTIDLTSALEEAKRRALPMRDLNDAPALQIPGIQSILAAAHAGLPPASIPSDAAPALQMPVESSLRIDSNALQDTTNAPLHTGEGVSSSQHLQTRANPAAARLNAKRIHYADLVAGPDNADQVDIFS